MPTFKPDRRTTYKTVGDGAPSIDIFMPDTRLRAGVRPCIVFFHGGGWKGGTATQFHPQCRYFASHLIGLLVLCLWPLVTVSCGCAPNSGSREGPVPLRRFSSRPVSMQGAPKEGYPITSLDFASDGGTLAAANHFDLRLWDTATGKSLTAPKGKNDEQFLNVLFAVKGEHLLSVSGKALRVWVRAPWKEVKVFAEGTWIAFSRDRLVVREGSTVNILSMPDWRVLNTLTNVDWDGPLTLSPDGRYLVRGEAMKPEIYPPGYVPKFLIWNADTGRLRAQLAGFAVGLAFSPDSTALAAIQNRIVSLWDVGTGKRLRGLSEEGFVPLCSFAENGMSI